MLTLTTVRERLRRSDSRPPDPERARPAPPVHRRGHPFLYSLLAGSVLLGLSAFLFGAMVTVLGVLVPSLAYVVWSTLRAGPLEDHD